jgi:hypothetical protein
VLRGGGGERLDIFHGYAGVHIDGRVVEEYARFSVYNLYAALRDISCFLSCLYANNINNAWIAIISPRRRVTMRFITAVFQTNLASYATLDAYKASNLVKVIFFTITLSNEDSVSTSTVDLP